MEAILISAGIALFTSLLGLVTWLMVAIVKHQRDGGHQTEGQRKDMVTAIEAQIKAHAAIDEQRFSSIEKMLEEMRADIKTLLKRRAK